MSIDNQLEKLITGKRVAIIGPAEYVCKELDDTHGAYIEQYDVIIRLNEFFYLYCLKTTGLILKQKIRY